MDDYPLSYREKVLLGMMHNIFQLVSDIENEKITQPALGQRCIKLLANIADVQRTLKQAPDAKSDFGMVSSQLMEALESVQSRVQSLQNSDIGELSESARRALCFAYERLVLVVRGTPGLDESIGDQLHTLRPKNYYRNVFHVANAIISVLMYEFVLGYWGCVIAMLSVLSCYAAMDIARRVWPEAQDALFDKLFSSITRPRERYTIPAATWYCVSELLVLLLCKKTVAQIAVLVLGVGDPAATLIGRRFGRIKIYRQKSLEGFLGFVGVSFLVCMVFLVWLRPLYPHQLKMAIVAAVVGALMELLGDDRFDDNLTIPLGVALVLSFVM